MGFFDERKKNKETERKESAAYRSNPLDANCLPITLKNARFDGSKVRLSEDVANMTMVHDRHTGVNTDFTISAVTCLSCGGSFNASKERNCSFCNTPFNAETEDWVVTELEIV